MDEILPGKIWLGSQFAVGHIDALSGYSPPADRTFATLKRHNITHILSCIDKPHLYEGNGIVYKTVVMSDSSSFDLLGCLKTTNNFIDASIESGGTVLVHCQMGESRSAGSLGRNSVHTTLPSICFGCIKFLINLLKGSLL